MSYSCIAVDDDPKASWFKLLSEASDNQLTFLSIERLVELSDLVSEIIGNKPALVALDYRLNENSSSHGGHNTYIAGSVAQHIRERFSGGPTEDFPLVLVSAEDKITEFRRSSPTSHDLFDRIYSKTDIASGPEHVVAELVGLVEGYREVGLFLSEERSIEQLFAMSEEEWSDLPFAAEAELKVSEKNYAHWVAKTLLECFIDRPGLLLRPCDVWARLGIDEDKSDTEALIEKFVEAGLNYTGAFSGVELRFWQSRFSTKVWEIVGKSLVAQKPEVRAEMIGGVFNVKLVPATSRWSGSSEELFSFACASCLNPTAMKHSVEAYDPTALIFNERKRICFDCIKKTFHERAGLTVSPSDNSVVEAIKSGEISRSKKTA